MSSLTASEIVDSWLIKLCKEFNLYSSAFSTCLEAISTFPSYIKKETRARKWRVFRVKGITLNTTLKTLHMQWKWSLEREYMLWAIIGERIFFRLHFICDVSLNWQFLREGRVIWINILCITYILPYGYCNSLMK